MGAQKGKILIVDDDKNILDSLKLLLKYEFETIDTIKNPNLLLQTYEKNRHDVVLLDMNFAAGYNTGNEGFYWMNKLLDLDSDAVIILITAYGDIDLAIRAIKEGAIDFIQKPWNSDKLIATLNAAINLRQSKIKITKLEQKNSSIQKDIIDKSDPIIGRSKAMLDIFKKIQKVAVTDANVLILGENGTGKELIAKEIHRLSKRNKEIFASVDMASITETLFESELFGHVKGAFTDAKEKRIGRFENASEGTLFLDEIGNLPASLQSKILTVLQNRVVYPLGSNSPNEIDVRLISATNKNLYHLAEQGLFREDLLYRINTVQIELPPLRERTDDIISLVEYYLNKFSSKYEKHLKRINSSIMEKLQQYKWPGNIRELKHTIEKAVILSNTDAINTEDLDLRLENYDIEPSEPSLQLMHVEKQTIIKALHKYKGVYSYAANELGISRTTLYAKIKKYGL